MRLVSGIYQLFGRCHTTVNVLFTYV